VLLVQRLWMSRTGWWTWLLLAQPAQSTQVGLFNLGPAAPVQGQSQKRSQVWQGQSVCLIACAVLDMAACIQAVLCPCLHRVILCIGTPPVLLLQRK
jgi:hypothetical protein